MVLFWAKYIYWSKFDPHPFRDNIIYEQSLSEGKFEWELWILQVLDASDVFFDKVEFQNPSTDKDRGKWSLIWSVLHIFWYKLKCCEEGCNINCLQDAEMIVNYYSRWNTDMPSHTQSQCLKFNFTSTYHFFSALDCKIWEKGCCQVPLTVFYKMSSLLLNCILSSVIIDSRFSALWLLNICQHQLFDLIWLARTAALKGVYE